MKLKDGTNEVFLSLGGNSAHKKIILKQAIQIIEQQIGNIEKESSLYETQPWGSESKHLFYNCVVKVITPLPATMILKKIRAIEKQFGRKRTKHQNSDRTLDIDILFFNRDIITTKSLQIPHPRLQLRNFVLVPFLEIDKNFIHPQLNKSILTLKNLCTDALKVRKLKHTKPLYICFEGNIGVGKTTLAKKMAELRLSEYMGELFEDNHLLPLFYKEPKTYAFALEWSMFLKRLEQFNQKTINHELMADFSIFKSLWFASVNLTKPEYKLFEKHFNRIYGQLPQPDLIVYLKTKPTQLLSNIKMRGRPSENRIKSLYLNKIERAYQKGIRTIKKQIPVLTINFDSYDQRNQQLAIETIQNYIKEKFGKIEQNPYF